VFIPASRELRFSFLFQLHASVGFIFKLAVAPTSRHRRSALAAPNPARAGGLTASQFPFGRSDYYRLHRMILPPGFIEEERAFRPETPGKPLVFQLAPCYNLM
jgi:hypothetical protein